MAPVDRQPAGKAKVPSYINDTLFRSMNAAINTPPSAQPKGFEAAVIAGKKANALISSNIKASLKAGDLAEPVTAKVGGKDAPVVAMAQPDEERLLMGTSNLIQGFATIGQAYSQSLALETQGEYQRQISDINARLSTLMAEDALARGDRAAADVVGAGREAAGQARAYAAAQGIKVGSGSAAQIQNAIQEVTERDAITARNNAWREAWGYRMQAVQATGAGKLAETAARAAASNTLLTGGLNALNYGIRAGWAYAGNKPKGRG